MAKVIKREKPNAEEVDAALAEEEKKKEKVVDKLIRIAITESAIFHTPASVAYADIPILGRRETWPIRSRGFKQWLVRIYYEETGSAPNSEALQSALALVEARANIDGPQREVFVRIGGANSRIYIDLANEQWQVIQIDATGWRILDSKAVPVRFRRAPGMLPLPLPVSGGSLVMMRPFVNVKSDGDFELAIAWQLASMRDRGPYPVLALIGEHGTAKTSFATILRSVIDPNTAALRTFPREDRDLFIAASNSWIVGFDNVSKIPAWISDTLCRLSTGGGFSTRKLYTDAEEAIFSAQRPIVLNGIEDFVERPDLADRTIFLTLEKIPEERRVADQALQAEIDRIRPQLLGALLDTIVTGLKRLPTTKLDALPRMADFALWATACERTPGAFMAAYTKNSAEAVEAVLEADVVATAVRFFMQLRGGKEWSGTATDLLAQLTAQEVGGETRSRGWPSDSAHLSGRLRRAAPALRKIGIDVEFDREGAAGTRTIIIKGSAATKKDRKEASAASAASEFNKSNGLSAGAKHQPASAASAPASGTVSQRQTKSLENNSTDATDGTDATFPTSHSNGNGAPLDHGDFLRRAPRRPALGPEGDSLDDLH
jgi:hypothetical protein